VTEVWQLFVSEGSAAFGAVDTAFGAWHGGHSLCGHSFWTQPLRLQAPMTAHWTPWFLQLIPRVVLLIVACKYKFNAMLCALLHRNFR